MARSSQILARLENIGFSPLTRAILPYRRVTVGAADRVPADDLGFIALSEEAVDFCLVPGISQTMSGNPGRTALLLPNRGVVINIRHAVSADLGGSVSLGDEAIELLLVCGGRQTMAGDPRAGIAGLFPDGGVPGLIADGVAADVAEAVSLADKAIESSLVIGRRQAMPGDPRTGWRFVPDGRVSVLSADSVSVDQDEPVALTDIGVDSLLILGRGQAMSRHPGGRWLLLPEGGVTGIIVDRVTADIAQAIASGHEAIKGALVLSRSQPMSSFPRVCDLGLDGGDNGQSPGECGCAEEFHACKHGDNDLG